MNMTEVFNAAYKKLGRGVVIKLHSGGVVHARLTKISMTQVPLRVCFTDSDGYHDSLSILEIERID